MFVTLKDAKTEVPLSEVKLVEESRGELVVLTMNDGSTFETYRHQWAQATRYQFQQVLPATPGTLLLCLDENDSYAPEYFEPVIGWAIHAAGGVQPLTHYGLPEDENPLVQHPDGRITNAGGGVYKSLEEYLSLLAEAKAEAQAA